MDETVLLVDDDAKLRKLLKEYLEGYGIRVLTLENGSEVLKTIRVKTPDMVILDIMLPQRDGLDILKEIRTQYSLPVIMLTAKGEDADRIVGLELGADDYVPKPFNPRELLARMRAVLRRLGPGISQTTGNEKDTHIKSGGLVLNKAKQTLMAGKDEMTLSSTEFKLMAALMSHPSTVLNRDQLMNLARGRDFMAFDRSIDVHISNIRAKLKSHPPFEACIKTVWGTGYMFVEEE
jgi:two-component system phosphate regulon response regulator OmpR